MLAGAGSAAAERSARLSERLGPALDSETGRRRPLKGVDLLAERLLGAADRRRRGRPDWAGADDVQARARGLSGLDERGFDGAIEAARSAVRLARDEPDAVRGAMAVGVEAVRRTIGLTLHREQVAGALALAAGRVAELATGEGKTVTAILPAAINGWLGRGSHVVTVNDYLARRDAGTCGPAYRRLGLSVGVLQDSSDHRARIEAYNAGVTYGADKQFIFDFLRDRLVTPVRPRAVGVLLDGLAPADARAPVRDRWRSGRAGWAGLVVQRGLFAAIVDECDSVLIDEAITPAIISVAPGDEDAAEGHYRAAAELAREMTRGEHFTVDESMRLARLTPAGREWLAARAAGLPPFWSGPTRREALLTQALIARELYTLGDDYIIRDGDVVIVDRSTGRVLPGRQWQLGLHQAVEAKEGLRVTPDRTTGSRISYQRFFQKYARLSGMTGTAWEVRDELWRWYRLPVVRVPTHRPVIRTAAAQRVFASGEAKMSAVAARAAELHASGRPVLVGTRSVAASETLSGLLTGLGVPHEVLNATREEHEARIVEEAGRRGAVTVATNMAGRGTDITLDEESRRLGGLVVIVSERHDERRVDRQLAGRAGRQGDPGAVETFVALDDPLIRRHGLAPLVWLARAARGGLGGASSRLLWWSAQHAAGRRWAAVRAQNAIAEDWTELALHRASR